MFCGFSVPDKFFRMSSFVGLLNLNGAQCAPDVVAAMLDRLRHRVTPDGARRASVRCRGPVGLGCAVLPTTARARRELEQPDAHQVLREGDLELWIASDGRLDNREEILGALGAGGEAREWSDGRVMLAAYARWGEASARRLRGDFAYAIWDARRRRLFCARDLFGVKPFYYAHVPGQFFAFASEIKALWSVAALDSSENPAQIADYLASRTRDKTSTFYQNVQRLAPAHWLSLSLAPGASDNASESDELRPQLYWELDGKSELKLPGNAGARDDNYARLVRVAFEEALEQRMSCDGKLAAFLSGGLDSSCIAALAEAKTAAPAKPLTTFSTIFERFGECDERAYIDQTLARGDFDPLWMNGDNISPFGDMERILWHLDGPSPGPNICSAWAQYRVLGDAGVDVVLDGHGGDEILCKGYERIGELLYERQFAAAWHELRLLRRHGVTDEAPSSQVWGAMLWHARDKRGLGRASRILRNLRRAPKADSVVQLNEAALDVMTPRCRAWLEDLEDKEGAGEAPDYTLRARHLHDIDGPLQALALEGIDAMSGAHAIETRCPFWEPGLAQLCLSLPADQKLRHGHNRYVMRRAMQGTLAPGVQWRRDKTDFAPQITTMLRESEGAHLEQFLAQWQTASSSLGRYVDAERVEAQWQLLQATPSGSSESSVHSFTLWKVFSLGLWLATQ